jgi:quercetin dioxygenase-like cupin family protein
MTTNVEARSERPVTTELGEFRLHDEIERLKRETPWSSGHRNAITLTKGALRTVLVVLKEGATIEEHEARGAMTLHVLSGSIRFRAAGRTLELTAGQLVVLESVARHDVEAVTDSAFLLTLAAA